MGMVLEMKILKAHKQRKRYKRPGSILMTSIVAVIVWIFIAQCMFVTSAGGFEMIKSSRTALQSQQYAQITIDRLKRLYYDELDEYGAHDRAVIPGLPSDDWEDEVTIGPELDIPGSEDIKQRIATVNIYKKDDTLPRYSVEVPFSSLDNKLPVGSIMAWPSNTPPSPLEWLECNGQIFDKSKYKRLANVFPNGVLPDLREKFLEGHDVAGTNISSGLPSFYAGVEGSVRANEGKNNTWYYYRAGMYHEVREYFSLLKDFNISVNGENVSVNVTKEYLPFVKGNLWTIPNYQNQIRTDVMSTGTHNINLAGAHLYGKASTVQPNSFTVKFYIKAR